VKKSYDKEGFSGLKDSREQYSGRPKSRELTYIKKMEKLEVKIKFFKNENKFLKKLKKMRRGW